MRRQITRISVGQTAKVLASLYFVVAAVGAIIYFIAMSSAGTSTVNPMFILLFPFIYAVIIWLVLACMLWVYNQVASRIGGVEFESADIA
jgi:hypothetical protein